MKKNVLIPVLAGVLMVSMTACGSSLPVERPVDSSAPSQLEEIRKTEQGQVPEKTAGALPGDGEEPVKTDSSGEYEFEVYPSGTVITAYIGDREVTELTVPGELGGKPVVKLDTLSMQNIDKMERVVLPDSLLEIGPYAFSSCDSLSEIQFSSRLQKIGEMAFWFCGSLQYLTLPDSLTEIGNGAFTLSGVVGLVIPEHVSEMGTGIFFSCYDLDYVEFFNHPSQVPESMFSGCSALSSVTGLDSISAVGEGAFRGCSALDRVELPEGLERIEADAFSGCNALERIALPSTLGYIGDHAFYACGFYTMTIPAGVETVGEFAFNYNSNLESVTIEGASTQIQKGAFSRNRLSVCYMPSAVGCDEQAFDYTTEIVYTD